MIKFSLKNLSRRKTRSLLTLSGIVIGVAMIIALVSVSEGLSKFATDFISNFQGIFVIQKGVVDDIFSRIKLEDVDSIKKMAGVKFASGQVTGAVTDIDNKGLLSSTIFNFFIGVSPDDEEALKSTYNAEIDEGRFINSNDKYKVVLGEQIAKTYDKQVGDKISFNGIDWRVVGIFKPTQGFASSGIFIPLRQAQEISGLESSVVSMISVIPDDPSKVDDLVRRIDLRYPNLDARSPQEISKQAGSYLDTMRLAFWLISIVAGIVGGIGVANTMITSVYERTREIGVLRAVGWTQRNIITLILTEGIVISIIGAVLGIILGSFVAGLIGNLTGFQGYVSPMLVLQAFTFAVTVGLIGGLYPAVKAAQLDPIQALRFE